MSGPLALCAPASRKRCVGSVPQANAGQCRNCGSKAGYRGVVPDEFLSLRLGAALGRAVNTAPGPSKAPGKTEWSDTSRASKSSGGGGVVDLRVAVCRNHFGLVMYSQIGPVASQIQHMTAPLVFRDARLFASERGTFFQKTRCCFSGMNLEEMQGTKPALTLDSRLSTQPYGKGLRVSCE